MKIANKMNKQACMIIFHVQCLSTDHGFFVIAVFQNLKQKNSFEGLCRVYSLILPRIISKLLL